ncbi:hypothetical protein AB0F46_42465 [Streptomyces sp. NPDC026665]
MDCTAWRQLAENVAESASKGARLVAAGPCGPIGGRPRSASAAPV